eukprot:503814-Ditylum_brightwellii.AAC.1
MFGVANEEGLFPINDGGGEIGVSGSWGIRIVRVTECFADVLLEFPLCLFLLKKAAVDKRGATVLSSETCVSKTQ